MKIFIVGGKRHLDNSTDETSINGKNVEIPASPSSIISAPFPFNDAVKELGRCAAKRGHTILVTSEGETTADYHFMQGVFAFAAENPQQQVFVDVYYDDDDAIPYQNMEGVYPNIEIDFLPYRSPKNMHYRRILKHTAAINACDAVICLGGDIGTFVAGSIATERGIPTIPVRASGGSAEALYLQSFSHILNARLRRRNADIRRLLGNQWNSNSAEAIIKVAENLGRTIDFAILCPLKEEREAVIRALERAGCSPERHTINGKTYWRTQIRVEAGPPYGVVVGQLLAMGNVAGALSANDVIERWRPRAVLVVGIGGSLDSDINPGDVVVGSSVLYNEMGKAKDGSFKPEPYMYPADAILYGQAQTLPPWDWHTPTGKNQPRVHFGVIAAGEKVLADNALKAALIQLHRKLFAVEMESAGISMAVWNTTEPVRQLSIRGISDRATPDKDKDDISTPWRADASDAAAEFAVRFIRYCDLP